MQFGKKCGLSGLKRLRKNSVPGRKEVPQGLTLAAARQPNLFSIIYGPTKEAAEKHHRKGTGSAVPLWMTGNEASAPEVRLFLQPVTEIA
jgi:hypothetical protein